MKECYELSHEELDLKSVVLEESDSDKDEEDIFVGNGRVREILDFGLLLDGAGYNIYLSADEGLNTVEFLKKISKKVKVKRIILLMIGVMYIILKMLINLKSYVCKAERVKNSNVLLKTVLKMSFYSPR